VQAKVHCVGSVCLAAGEHLVALSSFCGQTSAPQTDNKSAVALSCTNGCLKIDWRAIFGHNSGPKDGPMLRN